MRARVRARLVEGALCSGLWLVLWQRVSLGAVLSGVVVAACVLGLARLPRHTEKPRFAPAAVPYLLRFLGGILVGAATVAWWVVTGPRRIRGVAAVVHLRSTSSTALTAVAATVSAQPGALVIHSSRRESVLHVHAVTMSRRADPDAEVRRVRKEVGATEERVVRAFGTEEDRARLTGDGGGHERRMV